MLPSTRRLVPKLITKPDAHEKGQTTMRHVTLEQLTDILEVMIIEQTIDRGFAITYLGHVEGQTDNRYLDLSRRR